MFFPQVITGLFNWRIKQIQLQANLKSNFPQKHKTQNTKLKYATTPQQHLYKLSASPTHQKVAREPREAREPRDPRDPREAREARDPRDPSNPSDPSDPREPREPREPSDPSDPRELREPSDPREPREPRKHNTISL